MKSITPLFVTQLYVSNLSSVGELDISELEVSCHSIAEDDLAGQQWCEDNGYSGYTSYASLSDLTWRFPIFSELKDVPFKPDVFESFLGGNAKKLFNL